MKGYLATHSGSVIRLVVADEADEGLDVRRGALELLARILAHMAAGEAGSIMPSHC